MPNTIYIVETCMGKVNSIFGHPLNFLSESEKLEFDEIGYTGKNFKKEKISKGEFLNSLGKGVFTVEQTKYDNGDFDESFVIARFVESI